MSRHESRRAHIGLEVEGNDVRIAGWKGDREFLQDAESAQASMQTERL